MQAAPATPAPSRAAQLAFIVAALALLCLLDAAGLDLLMARWSGTPHGFALRDQRLFSLLSHQIPRIASGALLAALAIATCWPFGVLRQLTPAARLQLVATVLAGILLISGIKHFSLTSCPWSLQEFGGAAHYVSHWQWGVADGGRGHCFPAGHASAAFAYAGGWFVWRAVSRRLAALWLAAALIAGAVLGISQQVRGAHYMSHTLWTLWFCWTASWVIDLLATPWRRLTQKPQPNAD